MEKFFSLDEACPHLHTQTLPFYSELANLNVETYGEVASMSIHLFMPFITTNMEVLQCLWVGCTQGWGRSFVRAALSSKDHGISQSHYHERSRGGSKGWFSMNKKPVLSLVGFLKLFNEDRNGKRFFMKVRNMPISSLSTGGLRENDDGISNQKLSTLDKEIENTYSPRHAADCAASLNVMVRSILNVELGKNILHFGSQFFKDILSHPHVGKDMLKWTVGVDGWDENNEFLKKIRKGSACEHGDVPPEMAQSHCKNKEEELMDLLLKMDHLQNKEYGIHPSKLRKRKIHGFQTTAGKLLLLFCVYFPSIRVLCKSTNVSQGTFSNRMCRGAGFLRQF